VRIIPAADQDVYLLVDKEELIALSEAAAFGFGFLKDAEAKGDLEEINLEFSPRLQLLEKVNKEFDDWFERRDSTPGNQPNG
jgi:hypothetical protein